MSSRVQLALSWYDAAYYQCCLSESIWFYCSLRSSNEVRLAVLSVVALVMVGDLREIGGHTCYNYFAYVVSSKLLAWVKKNYTHIWSTRKSLCALLSWAVSTLLIPIEGGPVWSSAGAELLEDAIVNPCKSVYMGESIVKQSSLWNVRITEEGNQESQRAFGDGMMDENCSRFVLIPHWAYISCGHAYWGSLVLSHSAQWRIEWHGRDAWWRGRAEGDDDFGEWSWSLIVHWRR